MQFKQHLSSQEEGSAEIPSPATPQGSSPLLFSPSPPMMMTTSRKEQNPTTQFSCRSPVFSEASCSTVAVSDSEDSVSVASTSGLKKEFCIPDSWPPLIQACIDQKTDDERKRELLPTVRSEICRVLANSMFCYDPNPRKELCTRVAKLLVKKYKFMNDAGRGVTGYVSAMYSYYCISLWNAHVYTLLFPLD